MEVEVEDHCILHHSHHHHHLLLLLLLNHDLLCFNSMSNKAATQIERTTCMGRTAQNRQISSPLPGLPPHPLLVHVEVAQAAGKAPGRSSAHPLRAGDPCHVADCSEKHPNPTNMWHGGDMRCFLTSWPGPFKNGRQTRCQNNMSPSRHPLCCDLGVCSWLCLSCPQAKRRSRAWALLAERKETEGDPLKKCMCTQKTLLCWMFATRNLVFLGVFATKTCDLFLMFATNTCDLFLMVATKNCDLFGCLPLKTWIYDLSMRELDWAGNFPVRVGILPAPERKIPPPTDFKSIDSPLSKASRVVFNIRVRN